MVPLEKQNIPLVDQALLKGPGPQHEQKQRDLVQHRIT